MIAFLYFLYGLIIGSFLNVCIYRIPKDESIINGPSHCGSCGAKIRYRDLIPVVSFLLLGGRCHACKARISPQYPLVELLNAFLYLAVFYIYSFSAVSVIICLFISVLIVLAGIDLTYMLVPDVLNLVILILGIAAAIFGYRPPLEHIIGLFAVSLPLFIIAYITGGFGMGDILLYVAAGLLVGYKLALLSFFAACMSGALCSLPLLIFKKKKGKTEIPFVPFIAFGLIFSVLWGDAFLAWYFSLFI